MAKAKKLPSGSWRVMLYDGKDDTGKRIYKSFTADTKKEAEYMAAEYAANKNQSHAVEAAKLTVGQAIDKYIEARDAVLSPSTVREYEVEWRNHLQQLMNVKLSDLTQEKIQAAINADARRKSPKTVRMAYGLLSSVLSEYHPDFKLKTKLPQKEMSEMVIPSDTDVAELLKNTKSTKSTYMELAILFSSLLGMRRSEMCALTWGDIDFDNFRLTINKALVKDRNK